MMGQFGSFRFYEPLANHEFAVGATSYSDYYPGDEENARIVVRATPEGGDTINMIVDTGTQWCILNPELAKACGLGSREAYRPERALNIRGDSYHGRLVEIEIEIRADRGQDLTVRATAFIPELAPGQIWNVPNFLGLSGFLERIRFAVDARENAFYFGPADI